MDYPNYDHSGKTGQTLLYLDKKKKKNHPERGWFAKQ
jgi:hypothetical protein